MLTKLKMSSFVCLLIYDSNSDLYTFLSQSLQNWLLRSNRITLRTGFCILGKPGPPVSCYAWLADKRLLYCCLSVSCSSHRLLHLLRLSEDLIGFNGSSQHSRRSVISWGGSWSSLGSHPVSVSDSDLLLFLDMFFDATVLNVALLCSFFGFC